MEEIKTIEDLGVKTPAEEQPIANIEPVDETDYKALYEELEKKFEAHSKLYESAVKENQRLFSLCESYASGSKSKPELDFITKLIK